MKKLFYFLILFATIFIVGCSTETIQTNPTTTSPTSTSPTTTEDSTSIWMNAQLKDVRTGKSFKISDFSGEKILLESFAVWCPTCTRQQQKIGELHDEIGDEFISISIDTDPNEDESKIQEHLDKNGFDWLYAIFPEDATRALIKDFGIGIVNAPTAPIVLICEDGSTKFLGRGLKLTAALKSELAKGCG